MLLAGIGVKNNVSLFCYTFVVINLVLVRII